VDRSRRCALPKVLAAVLTVAALLFAAGLLAGCGTSEVTTTTTGSPATTAVTADPGGNTTSASGITTNTTPPETIETTVSSLPEQPSKPAAGLVHYWWDGTITGNLDHGWQAENISGLTENGADSTRIIGDAFRSDPDDGMPACIVAAGESGDLLVFANAGADAAAGRWSVTPLPSPTAQPLRELLGGRASASPLTVTGAAGPTGKASAKVLHVFATDTGDSLIHFWLEPGGSWQAEDVSQAAGMYVHKLGSVRTAEDGTTLEVCALDRDGKLLYFSLIQGGSWHWENPGDLLNSPVKGEATFIADPLGRSGTTVAASSRHDALLLFRRTADGDWTLEDLTEQAAAGGAGAPAVTLGGWLSSWDWDSGNYWAKSLFKHPLAVLTTAGHLVLLERASAAEPWKVADVSASIKVTFAADGGGTSIIRVCPPPGASSKEAHFAGVNEQDHLIHFWRDAKGTWHSEDYTASSGDKFAYPLGCFGAPWAASLTEGAGGARGRFFIGIAPNGTPAALSSPEAGWALVGSGLAMRGPVLAWGESGVSDLVLAGTK
jgi:hypothetical protein